MDIYSFTNKLYSFQLNIIMCPHTHTDISLLEWWLQHYVTRFTVSFWFEEHTIELLSRIKHVKFMVFNYNFAMNFIFLGKKMLCHAYDTRNGCPINWLNK